MAVANYEADFGRYPPRVTPDGYHSWRTILLPYREDQKLYSEVDLTSPWDSESNVAVRREMPHGLQCHNREDGTSHTQVFAVTGPNSIWEVGTRSIDDDLGETLLFIELDLPETHWMSTNDVSLTELTTRLGQGPLPSPHPGGVLMAFADGTIREVPHLEITAAQLRDWVCVTKTE